MYESSTAILYTISQQITDTNTVLAAHGHQNAQLIYIGMGCFLLLAVIGFASFLRR